MSRRDSIGGASVVGDYRWAGAFGVQADFVARSHCSVEIIKTEDIMVRKFSMCKHSHIANADVVLPFILQDVLEKFEFFPVKCRIQRAAEMFSKITEMRQLGSLGPQFKAKVLLP